jgi:hypothetical protein
LNGSFVYIQDDPFIIEGYQRIETRLNQSTVVALKILYFMLCMLALGDVTGSGKGTNHLSCLISVDRSIV